MPLAAKSTGVAITNPLVLYRALLATKRIDPDPAQHRLALHLQLLYERLKDYEPIVQYGWKLQQISRALAQTPGSASQQTSSRTAAVSERQGVLSALFKQRQKQNGDQEAMALTRTLTSQERAIELDSPKGLLLHGEVGTGKSMLVDLFADCLPNRKKRRWHFNTFMLETVAKLEQLRRSRQMIIPASLGVQDDYSLLWLARDLISTSPIIFLDEFQLPDRAASKIMTNLMTSFFQLGGVLIATSNRMPEELAKAAGMEFGPPPDPMSSLRKRMLGRRTEDRSDRMYNRSTEFAQFLDVLKARCEVWEMENTHDYRRRDSQGTPQDSNSVSLEDLEAFQGLHPVSTGNVGLGYEQSHSNDMTKGESNTAVNTPDLPVNYLAKPADDSPSILSSISQKLSAQESAFLPTPLTWESSSMRVYGRVVSIPRAYGKIAKWTFAELCEVPHGPADYVTLASTFHTIILTDVPILTTLKRNEARRFITLLDALYEARCKLLITASAGPDDLFFPDANPTAATEPGQETVSHDPVYSETIAEVFQDATAPFRPNVSSYTGDVQQQEYIPQFERDEGPDYTHARLAGLYSSKGSGYGRERDHQAFHAPDALEDGPPNVLRRGDSIYGRDVDSQYDISAGSPPVLSSVEGHIHPADSRSSGPNFSLGTAFTGEDEKFAYKRARSRLWEMCGARWWAREDESGNPDQPSWWTPLDKRSRVWERSLDDSSAFAYADPTVSAELAAAMSQQAMSKTDDHNVEGMATSRPISEQQDEVLFRHGASPFRTHSEPPPKMSWTHVWGLMKWGKKAGAWGQGVEGLEERGAEKRKERERALPAHVGRKQ